MTNSLPQEDLHSFFQNDRFAMDLGIQIEQIGAERTVCTLRLVPGHMNADHVAQGGVLFTLADFTFAVAANAGLTFVTPGFVASEEDTSIAVALKQGQEELVAQINEVLAGISADERIAMMDDAVLNQPVLAE